jgi:hypothetical protein
MRCFRNPVCGDSFMKDAIASGPHISVCVEYKADSLKDPVTFMLLDYQVHLEHETSPSCVSASRSYIHRGAEGIL